MSRTNEARKGKIHAARLANSPRLQRVLEALREAGAAGLTTREVIERAHVCAVSSCVDELCDEKNGYVIDCVRESRDIFRYRLVGEPSVPAVQRHPVSVSQPGPQATTVAQRSLWGEP